MAEKAIKLGGKKKSIFLEKVKELLPEGGNLNLCLTCGACSSGCPASGLDDMDPRKLLRMAALGMDEELIRSVMAGATQDLQGLRWKEMAMVGAGQLGLWLLWIAAALTLVTGVDYMQKALPHLREDD